MKITKYFFSMAAAVAMLAGCYQPEMNMIAAPEDVVAPVLEAVEGPIEITPTNMVDGKVAFSWSAADFGVATQVNYSLLAATAAAPETTVSITSGLTNTTAEVDYETLNGILFNDLKLNDGVEEDVLFTVSAKIGEYAPVYSNSIAVACKVTAAEKQYAKLFVVGSYNGWSHDKNQYLFDFEATDAVYQGIVDFGEDHASNEFKITGGAWGKDEHSMSGPHDAESKTITLVAGGGDNINVYQAKRYYHLTFDRALTLTADFSFDQLGVIGDFNGWGADVVMSFNEAKQRFYADVEFPADGGFKFRADAGWDVNWGVKDGVLEAGADNIPVTAGNYRVYVNMNNKAEMTFELNKGMFGKDEPVGGTTTPEPEPEPEPFQGWGLIGGFNGWGGDLALTAEGDYYVVKGAELEGELKFRKDADWGVNFGYAEGAEFAANAEIALAQDGANINVPAGTYDVYLDPVNAKAWFINDGSYPGGAEAPVAAEWGLIGSLAACNNWSNNVVLYVSGDYSVAKGVQFAAGDQFKFRKGEAWGVELTYEGQITIDAKLDLIDGTGGKQNSSIAEGGSFDVYLANDLSAFYVMTPGKTPADAGAAQKVYTDPSAESFVVGFSGGAIGWDDPSFDANDRAAFVSKNVTDEKTFSGTYEFQLKNFAVAAGDEFKVRINGQWIGVGGATVEGLKVSGSDNFVADEAGTYTATITFAWDGSNHSDVKVVFASEAAAGSFSVAGKQWIFDWKGMAWQYGMDSMEAVIDLGVTIENYCMAAINYMPLFGVDMWYAQIEGYYEVEETDATSGKIWLYSADYVTGELVRSDMYISYYDLTETTCTFDCYDFYIENHPATVAASPVTVVSQAIAM
ncbi:MAG: SusE domain-containing protein [Bacteroidales bacterium]|nr:SusE domain-containing protein [Bacteroidales bacterium]